MKEDEDSVVLSLVGYGIDKKLVTDGRAALIDMGGVGSELDQENGTWMKLWTIILTN